MKKPFLLSILLLLVSTAFMLPAGVRADTSVLSKVANLHTFSVWGVLPKCTPDLLMCELFRQPLQSMLLTCESATIDLGLVSPIEGKVRNTGGKCAATFDQIPNDARGAVQIKAKLVGALAELQLTASGCLDVSSKSAQEIILEEERLVGDKQVPCNRYAGTASVIVNGKIPDDKTTRAIKCDNMTAQMEVQGGSKVISGKLTTRTLLGIVSRDRCFFWFDRVPLGKSAKVKISGSVEKFKIASQFVDKVSMFGERDFSSFWVNTLDPEEPSVNEVLLRPLEVNPPSNPVQTKPAPPAQQETIDREEFFESSGFQKVPPNAALKVFIKVKNAGNTHWTPTRYGYRSFGEWATKWGENPIWREVPPGDILVFEDDVIAPSKPGTYNYGFWLLRDGKEFSPLYNVKITVVPTPDSSSSQTGATILTFENFGNWRRGNQKWGTFTQSQEQKRSGRSSGKFEYAIPKVPPIDSYLIFQRAIPIPGQPNAFQIWVYGDGEGNFLNIWVRDRNDRKWQFTFGRVTHNGVWQQMTAQVSLAPGWPNELVDGKPFPAEGIVYPLKLDALVIDGVDADLPSAGVIYVDDLTATTLPNIAAPPVSPPAQPTAAPVTPPQSPAPLNVVFQSDRTSINAGECVNLRWDVTEVNGVWLNGQGVPGQSNQQVCPTQTQEFKLKIQKRDGTFDERSITIQVSGNSQPPAANPPPVSAPAPAPVDTGYGTLGVIAADTRRPPEGNPDLNLSLLGYQPNGAAAVYKDYGSPDDPLAPQLRGLFADRRRPAFTTAFINNGWDWGSDSRTPPPPGQYEVTVIGVAVSPGESLFTPGSGRTIGNDYSALVLYADSNQITLKYTPEDSIARGYTVFVEGINVNPQLLALYQSSNSAGRGSLPALRAGQLLGTAHSGEIRIAIRDNATFMDPRSLQDWWR